MILKRRNKFVKNRRNGKSLYNNNDNNKQTEKKTYDYVLSVPNIHSVWS